jgi:hypothetical protein
VKAIVELRLFSGFPNLHWTLPSDDAKRLFERIEALPLEPPGFVQTPGYAEPLGRPRGGYRGFTITFEHGGRERVYDVFDNYLLDVEIDRVRRDSDRSIEKDVYASIPKQLAQEFLEGITYDEIKIRAHEGPIKGLQQAQLTLRCRTGPVYAGNTGPFKNHRRRNNCYNYATGVVNTVLLGQAIPGSPNVRRPLTMAKLRAAVESDLLEPLGMELPNECPPPGSHYVAVLLRRNPTGAIRDFHCLRLDRNGVWSHKDGDDVVRDIDDMGNPIINLKTASLHWDPELAGFYRFDEARRHMIK